MALLARSLLALAALLAAAPALAQTPTVPGTYYDGWYDANARDAEAKPPEFRLINYFFARATVANTSGDPLGLKGVQLGPFGAQSGSQVTTRIPGNAAFVEQRWIPVIEYTPDFLDGRASFRAQLEIDYVWGRSANTVQPNEGGGFNADQVNIQTKNVNVALYPFKDPDPLTFLIGTQPFYDSALDPTRSGLQDIVRGGYKLAYVGSDATGIQVFSQKYGRSRLGWFPLNSAPNVDPGDPRLKFSWIAVADHAFELAPGSWLGLSAWFLRDSTKGEAFAYEGLAHAGPGSLELYPFTGTQRFYIERANGQVAWLGANFSHNIDFRAGRFGASGFFMYNLGRYTSAKTDTLKNKTVDVGGFGADAEVLYNWGRTVNDLVTVEAIVSNGDSNPNDGKYTGPFTLNYYGIPGAVFFNHRMLLLMPFTSTVNNYSGAVNDLSNQGFGLVAGLATAARDLIPNKLNLRVGVGYGRSWATPAPYAAGETRGKVIGTEVNAELRYAFRYLMTVGLHGGYLVRGDWYDGATSRIHKNPFALFTTFTWYAF